MCGGINKGLNMRKVTIGILAALAVTCSALFIASGDAQKIEELKAEHKRRCESARSNIMAGYMACSLGLNLSNYLADVQALWDKQLADRIEGSKR